MKKFLSFILSICIAVTTLAVGFVTVFAEGNIIEGTNVTWNFNAETGTLSFEGEGAIPDYNEFITDGDLTIKYPWKDIAYKTITFAEVLLL